MSRAAKLIQTARQTSQLQRTPRKKAFWKDRAVLPAAVLMTEAPKSPPDIPHCPDRHTNPAVRSAPAKFPA